MRECDAIVDQLIDRGSSNKRVAERSDRVETLLIGAVPQYIGTHIEIVRLLDGDEERRQILADRRRPRNLCRKAAGLFGLSKFTQILQSILPPINSIKCISYCRCQSFTVGQRLEDAIIRPEPHRF